jgi:hypothetical protein
MDRSLWESTLPVLVHQGRCLPTKERMHVCCSRQLSAAAMEIQAQPVMPYGWTSVAVNP